VQIVDGNQGEARDISSRASRRGMTTLFEAKQRARSAWSEQSD
jgi:hypothetical protein